jgi:hypothetical protein
MVTIDVGPRIIFLGKDLKNNILFEDVRRNFQMKSPAFKKIFGKNALWDAYGGHRI